MKRTPANINGHLYFSPSSIDPTTAEATTGIWKPRNIVADPPSTDYGFYGTIGKDQKLLVYGEKREGAARRPQSRRVVNETTIRAIISGSLKPVPGGKHLDVHSLGEEGSFCREAYLAATGTTVNA